ncbi:hypothetical protein FPRO04_02550 [Fusarium proliferatum]|nr:hypothetical protein FPRO04_02550 [Fusarium proliferatum]
MSQTTSVPEILSSFTEKWSPRLIASVNDHHVKVAKIDGSFIWHAHPDSEELFYLLSGKLTMEIQDEEPVVMKEGDIMIALPPLPLVEAAHVNFARNTVKYPS